MNTVKRAVIVAAGIGKRMRPISYTTPKPLIKVNGVRMIDTIIDSLEENGIREIYIVTGYMKEQFEVLRDEHPEISLIENPYYDTCNNISSLYVARDHLEDCMILDGDQIIRNSAVLSPFFESSGYNAIWTDGYTDEWLMQADDKRVRSCSRTGGKKGWQLYSISRWTSEDGKRLKHYLELEFDNNHNRQIYWDDVVMFCHFDDFELDVYPMDPEDVVEIDDYVQLCALDRSYEKEGINNAEKKD